jgi:hypothetical protein
LSLPLQRHGPRLVVGVALALILLVTAQASRTERRAARLLQLILIGSVGFRTAPTLSPGWATPRAWRPRFTVSGAARPVGRGVCSGSASHSFLGRGCWVRCGSSSRHCCRRRRQALGARAYALTLPWPRGCAPLALPVAGAAHARPGAVCALVKGETLGNYVAFGNSDEFAPDHLAICSVAWLLLLLILWMP